jgi:hypothetical protein
MFAGSLEPRDRFRDLRATIRALILANEFLEAHTSKGFVRGYDHGRFKTCAG